MEIPFAAGKNVFKTGVKLADKINFFKLKNNLN